jgi:hypothetical protein
MADDSTRMLYEELRKDWPLAPLRHDSEEVIFEALAAAVNELIQRDFHRLMSILYRIDVSEQKIRHMLGENKGIDAARIISHLIIDRKKQKIRSRQEWKEKGGDVAEEEKW